MPPKNKILLGIVIGSTLLASILLIAGKTILPLIIFDLLTIFVIFAVFDPPEKHKTFGYRDLQRAMRAFDRSALKDFETGCPDQHKKK